MADKKKVHIFGLAWLKEICEKYSDALDVIFHENENNLQEVLDSPSTKIVFMNARSINFPTVRKNRKDIFLCGYLVLVTGGDAERQYTQSIVSLKRNSANLICSHEVGYGEYMVTTPEEAFYHRTIDLEVALTGFVEMAYLRSHLTFTRSTVVAGENIPWNSELIPNALRTVVDYCIQKNAYKPLENATVGHFACKINDHTFLTSVRRSNFNNLDQIGLVKIETDGPDNVIAYGSKPSVGGQSQRIVFSENKDYDCIVHFHCPLRVGKEISTVSQREYECGSHECGRNTANGLKKYGNLSAVFLDQHGPNIVFNSSINPQEVIDFIENNFDLSKKTGGYVDLGVVLT